MAIFAERRLKGDCHRAREEVLPIMVYTGRLCPPRERDTFFRLKVYQRVRIFPVEVYERVGKSVISVRKKAQNLGLTDLFMAMKKSRKRSGFVIYFYFKDSAFTAVKRMQYSKLDM